VIAILMWAVTVGISVTAFLAGGATWLSTRRQQRTTQFMYRSCKTLLAARDLDDASVDLVRRACEHFHADIGVLKLFPTGPEGAMFRTLVRGGHSVEVMQPVDAEDDDALGGLAPVGVVRVQAMSAEARITQVATRLGVGEGLAVALRHDERAVGQLLLGRRSAKVPFAEPDVQLFQTYADLIAMTLERSRLHDALVRICALQSELADNAFHDPLTQLANRVLLVDRVDSALRQRDTPRDIVAVVYVDLDGFTRLNSEHGHVVGDAMLVEVAKRLRSCMRRSDTAARLGGDEFAVLLVELIEPREAELIAQRIVASIAKPIKVDGKTLSITATVGVASAKAGSVRAAQLLRRAENAHDSLRQHPDDSGFDVTASARLGARVAGQLTAALERNELVLHFQPIVELVTGKILGAEALVRWMHPKRGLIAPMHFLPAAAECGLSHEIEAYVLRAACLQVRRWQDRYQTTPPLAISVNMSATELRAPTFTDDVNTIVRESGADPACVIIEVTENAVLEDLHEAIATFDALQRAGVHVAIDDVGTGYTSLAYLRRLPIDILKIARPLVAELADPGASGELARTVVRHGQALRLVLVAEGIEEPLQVRRLEELGCTMGQGFHLARPCDAAAMEALLETGKLDAHAYAATPATTPPRPSRRTPVRSRQVRSPRAAARNPA
jgi:diguanylate cyclase (GGDEF)-like protein